MTAGDSGAWVIDPVTNELYGHVVASDVFGIAYVIPIDDIFKDIKLRLSLKAIKLRNFSRGETLAIPKVPTRSDKIIDKSKHPVELYRSPPLYDSSTYTIPSLDIDQFDIPKDSELSWAKLSRLPSNPYDSGYSSLAGTTLVRLTPRKTESGKE